ncbi:hypothetical protein N836_12780 [Leptolyngbya sp. Heron Island J]|nr:hypothetical protein [Leptolyngbya sp. Heron Island J]ESA35245.1 hypothetical protein N836_12780 [Leptolyngbya sp. Heron Island J]
MVKPLTRWTVADYHHMIATGLLAGRSVELINLKFALRHRLLKSFV